MVLLTEHPGTVILQCALLQKEKRIICIANQNGSQADCELGNPFKRDSEVRTCLQHQPSLCSLCFMRSFKGDGCLFVFHKATFYIILSTLGIPLDTTEIDIDLQLQT